MSENQSTKVLLAMENISQAIRKGLMTPEAIEGICRFPDLFKEIGRACRSRRVCAYELQELINRHMRFDSCARIFHFERLISWNEAREMMRFNFIEPYDFEQALRGHIRFTREQLEKLVKIPFSQEMLGDEGYRHDAILFPMHPDVTLDFLFKKFGYESGAEPRFGQEACLETIKQINPMKSGLYWCLARRKPEPVQKPFTWTEYNSYLWAPQSRMIGVVECALSMILTRYLNEGQDSFMAQRAWCSEVARTKFGEEELPDEEMLKSWVIGPYDHKTGIKLKAVPKTTRDKDIHLFLVHHPTTGSL